MAESPAKAGLSHCGARRPALRSDRWSLCSTSTSRCSAMGKRRSARRLRRPPCPRVGGNTFPDPPLVNCPAPEWRCGPLRATARGTDHLYTDHFTEAGVPSSNEPGLTETSAAPRLGERAGDLQATGSGRAQPAEGPRGPPDCTSRRQQGPPAFARPGRTAGRSIGFGQRCCTPSLAQARSTRALRESRSRARRRCIGGSIGRGRSHPDPDDVQRSRDAGSGWR